MRKKIGEDDLEVHVAFSRDEVERIARILVHEQQEGEKVDFKREIGATSDAKEAKQEANSSLLKDLCAFVNTYDRRYKDHGFLIFGAVRGQIVGIEHTERDPDTLSNHVEQLIKEYLAPVFGVQVHMYQDEQRTWGVILIPPSRMKPHILGRDFACKNPKKRLHLGDWFVRQGGRTVKAGPAEYARVLQESLLAATEPLRAELDLLRTKYQSLSERVESRTVDALVQALGGGTPKALEGTADGQEFTGALVELSGASLAARLQHRLAGPFDAESRALQELALDFRTYLTAANGDLPWQFGNGEAEVERRVVEELEERVGPLLNAVATVACYDDNGPMTDAVTQVVKILAKEPSARGTYTDAGVALRLYPILLVLNTIFAIGAPLGRADLLRRCLDVELRSTTAGEGDHIASVGFRAHALNGAFRRASIGKACGAVNVRAREIVSSVVYPLLPGEERSHYYIGEFIFGLGGIEARGIDTGWTLPCPGTYLYASEARSVLEAYLRSAPAWLEGFYRHHTETMLEQFDATARLGTDKNCFASGFTQGAADAYRAP